VGAHYPDDGPVRPTRGDTATVIAPVLAETLTHLAAGSYANWPSMRSVTRWNSSRKTVSTRRSAVIGSIRSAR